MKIIHAADIHLGSKMDTRLGKDKAKERKAELRDSFDRMADYAESNGVSVIMLSGDIFDSDDPSKKDKESFYATVRAHPGIDFLYLKGNHDIKGLDFGERPANLKTFSDDWAYFEYGNVVIAGVEIRETNRSAFYSFLQLDKNKINIVMLHGQIGESDSNSDINLKKLRGKNIDYLALGHIHKHEEGVLDDRGEYVYCGCLEGRGFDEPGEHGFELIDVEDGKITHRFTPFSIRIINVMDVDVSGSKDNFEALNKIKLAVKFDERNLFRINLVGELGYDAHDLAEEAEMKFTGYCYCLSVKDNTRRKIDLSAFENDLSIKGEFVRRVQRREEISDSDKATIISLGLNALDGKGLDI